MPPPRAAVKKPPQKISAERMDSVKLRWEALAGGFTKGVAIHERHQKVFLSTNADVLSFGLEKGAPQQALPSCQQHVRGGLHVFADSLLTVCADAVEQHDLKRKTRTPLKVAATPISASALAGSKLALAHYDGVIRIRDLLGGASVNIVVPGPPIEVKSLALSPDGRLLAVAWTQGSIWWWELSAPNIPHELVRHPSESDALAFSQDSKLLAEEGQSSFTTVWEVAATPRALYSLRNGAWVKRLLFMADDNWLIRGGSEGLELAEINGPKRVALDTSGQVEDVAQSATASLIAAGDRKGRLTVWGL